MEIVNKESFCHLSFLQNKKHDCLAKIAQICSSLLLTGGNHMDEGFYISLHFCVEVGDQSSSHIMRQSEVCAFGVCKVYLEMS